MDSFYSDFVRDGFCILPQFIDPATLRNWSRQFAPLLEAFVERQADASFRGSNRHYISLPFRAPFADPQIFDNDTIVSIVERIVGKDFVMCQLASDTPTLGSDYQPIHADAPQLFPTTDWVSPPFQLAVNFPLCDVTAENGATEIARGTHMMKKEEGLAKIAAGEIKLENIAMKLGDVMIRDVRGLHRGTPNRTMIPRPMVVIGYSPKWFFRPEVSIQIPRAEFEKLSPRAKHMLRFNPIVETIADGPQQETYKAFAY